VGIDGCGKTKIARRLSDHDVVVLHTYHPHETVNGPFRELSPHLQTLSAMADRLHSPQLKVAAYYLLLRTYAPTERFLTRTLAPHTIVSDGHPLIDSLVHLPLHHRTAAALAARVPDWQAAVEPSTRRAILAWTQRLECEPDLWALGHRLLSLRTASRGKLLLTLSGLLHTELPDVVIHLDVEVTEALHHVGDGQRHKELHEATQLPSVRTEYEAVIGWLATQPAPVTVHRIACGTTRTVDEIAAEVADRLSARVLIAAG
jgi:hypothetical protein